MVLTIRRHSMHVIALALHCVSGLLLYRHNSMDVHCTVLCAQSHTLQLLAWTCVAGLLDSTLSRYTAWLHGASSLTW